MAYFPPRRKSFQSISSWADKSTSEILQLMGFPKTRVEKAIAATGSQGVQQASDWLLSHVNDPTLDAVVPREYIIYLCPKGQLQDQLVNFWTDSLIQTGWNSAHTYQPHVTLCSFFTMADGQVDILDPLMELVVQELSHWPYVGPLKLDLYTKNKSFIGYFVTSPQDQYVENLMVRLQQEFLKAGVEIKPQQKQLHMTLAFQYSSEHHDTLMSMAQGINLNCESHWEIQVFSRDPVVKAAEVRSILKHYKPSQADELELNLDDFVYMDPEELSNSPDGWFKGTSWKTGLTAYFPGNFTTRCAQMEVWTLHRYASLANFSSSNNGLEAAIAKEKEYDNVWFADSGPVDLLYSKPNKQKTKVKSAPPRRLLITRHGERCDFAFSKTWFDKSFDSEGNYTRINLNCPKLLVRRAAFEDFNRDCPLTLMGQHQAKLTGEALLDAGESITSVFCSPALRCVETATQILKGMRSPCRLKVESALFEWCGWYKPLMPKFLTPAELHTNGFPVDPAYSPYLTMEDISKNESVHDYYNRSHSFASDVLKKHKPDDGTILFVGHSGTLDACTREILGQPSRDIHQFTECVRGCPYLGMCCLTGSSEGEGGVGWQLVEPPILPLTHGANKATTWKKFLT